MMDMKQNKYGTWAVGAFMLLFKSGKTRRAA